MRKFTLTVLAAAALMLGACANNDVGMKEGVGTVLGGVGGAVAGSQFGKGKGQLAATAAGTLIGAFVGNQIGQSLDKADRAHAERAMSRAQTAPVGESIAWNNPDSGNHGTVRVTRDGHRSSDGAYCREFQNTITVGGKQEQAYGTACRQPDGSWKIVQ